MNQERMKKEIKRNQSVENILSFPTDETIWIVDNEQVECFFIIEEDDLSLSDNVK